ncbi:hypothetical protein [Nonomuraea sp. 10N515B]|uniref:hypothetical protein n=1 Tax=Nonomuraea sp. 10N515B TaxID=3457422 RepID=UPI003FCDB4B5
MARGVAKLAAPFGSEAGATALMNEAAGLQALTKFNGGTTAIIRIFNTATGQYRKLYASAGKAKMPHQWKGRVSSDDFAPAARGQHAEEALASKLKSLGDDWKVIEGGVNRNVCKGKCEPLMNIWGVLLGGPKFPWRMTTRTGPKTEYRLFWRVQ